MDLTFLPLARFAPLVYAEAGGVLTVNGRPYDFESLGEVASDLLNRS